MVIEKGSPDIALNPNQYKVFGRVYETLGSSEGYIEIGVASWYGKKFHGKMTSMGELYDMNLMTAAHKTLPLPTTVKVTNLDNQRKVVLRVNDRGPFHDDRLIDLSYAAAEKLGFSEKGLALVVVEVLGDEYLAKAVDSIESKEPTMIQVGAFSEYVSAHNLSVRVRSLLPENVSVRVFPDSSGAVALYKVLIGPILDEEEKDSIIGSFFGSDIESVLLLEGNKLELIDVRK